MWVPLLDDDGLIAVCVQPTAVVTSVTALNDSLFGNAMWAQK